MVKQLSYVEEFGRLKSNAPKRRFLSYSALEAIRAIERLAVNLTASLRLTALGLFNVRRGPRP